VLPGFAILVAERDLLVRNAYNPIVAERYPKDVGGKVAERGVSAAHGAAIHDPRLVPCVRAHGGIQGRLPQCRLKLRTKEQRQRLHVDQEATIADLYWLRVSSGSISHTDNESSQYRTFLHNHAHEIWACDFLPVTDVLFRPLYAFVIVQVSSRKIMHVGVTRHPTDAWTAQQVREATPFDEGPTYLVRDNDA
jgi:hypothetical protein